MPSTQTLHPGLVTDTDVFSPSLVQKSGPFYFALCGANELSYGSQHRKEDFEVISFNRDWKEGNKPTLQIVVRNPHRGLLAAGQKRYAWFSFYNAGTDTYSPLFYGRIVAIPTSIIQEKVTVNLICDPQDYDAQKISVAAALNELPWFDPVFTNPANDGWSNPDNIVEARSGRWCTDPVTHVVSLSDISVGEDGTVTFDETTILQGSLDLTFDESPLRFVSVDADVHWVQQHTSVAPLLIDVQDFVTYSGDGFIGDWPKVGVSLGGGYTAGVGTHVNDVTNANDQPTVSYTSNYTNRERTHNLGDTMNASSSWSGPAVSVGPHLGLKITGSATTGDDLDGTPASANMSGSYTELAEYHLITSLYVDYAAKRTRKEHLTFTLGIDLQAIITDTSAITQTITIAGNDVGTATADSSIPIGDLSRRSYFPQARGLLSLEYLVLLARAHLLSKARAGTIKLRVSFENALALLPTLRKNAHVVHPALPGGEATGKIIGISLQGAGNGKMFAEILIGCTCGHGISGVNVPGDPVYIEGAYIETPYYFYSGQSQLAASNDVNFTIPIDSPNDDGLVFPLTADQILVSKSLTGVASAQLNAAATAVQQIAALDPTQISSSGVPSPQPTTSANSNSISAAILANPMALTYVLKPLTNQTFEDSFDIVVSDLQVHDGLDLEASS